MTEHPAFNDVVAQIAALATGAEPKPAFGSPCNGCGMCCIAEQCPVSLAAFGRQPLCPALRGAGKALACGLLVDPSAYLPRALTDDGRGIFTGALAKILGAGFGCDSEAPWEEEVPPDVRARMTRKADDPELVRAYGLVRGVLFVLTGRDMREV